MFFTNLFKIKKNCNHEKITPDLDCGYCPDCGRLIQNEWYITRCACCGVKLKANIKNGEIIPQNRYCTNCGSEEYIIGKLDKIDFININFAVLEKRIVEEDLKVNTIQCWQEKNIAQPKLLVQYL